MPRIDQDSLDCVFYLYPSIVEAQEGKSGAKRGGSGFFISTPFPDVPGVGVLFAVTASHVINRGSDVIRLNAKDGSLIFKETDAREWFHHPDGADIAILPVEVDKDVTRFRCLPRAQFALKKLIDDMDVGAGDNIFIVGRFINQEGTLQNTPTARFGHLAQMPVEKITSDDGEEQESYLVEVRSIGGFSGSPVFIYFEPFGIKGGRKLKIEIKNDDFIGPWLLGIDWCHTHNWLPVCDRNGEPISKVGDQIVGSNTGMMGVIPAWKLEEMLAMPKIKKVIDDAQQAFLNERGPPKVSLDSAGTVENSTHREDFNRLLGAAVKPPKSSDQT